MKKKILQRALIGFPLGIFISYTISIIIAAIVSNGSFHSIAPSLAVTFGSEINAVIVQYFVSGMLGIAMSAPSVLFETESFSPLKQTVLHFIILSSSLITASLLMGWIPVKFSAIALFIIVFVVLYIIIWIGITFASKKELKNINSKIK